MAVASSVPWALRRYSTAMPLGIQRIEGGRLASTISPPASSARLHMAIAWTVPMWLRTARRSRSVALQQPGSSCAMRGRIEPK